jgi:hypothetical protein
MGRFVVWSAVGGNFGFLLWLRQSDGLVKVPLGDQCLWGIVALWDSASGRSVPLGDQCLWGIVALGDQCLWGISASGG